MSRVTISQHKIEDVRVTLFAAISMSDVDRLTNAVLVGAPRLARSRDGGSVDRAGQSSYDPNVRCMKHGRRVFGRRT